MTLVKPPNEIDPKHLETVVEYMVEHGPPKIHAVWDAADGQWFALEGSHRLVAAKMLGMTPEIIPVDYGDDLLVSYGIKDAEVDTVAEMFKAVHDFGPKPLKFDVEEGY